MKKEIRFKSDLSNLDRVEKYVNALLEVEQIDENDQGSILISVVEGVTNAIVHGNKSDATKDVVVEFVSEENQIGFKITDEGPGFDFEKIPDPTLPENIESLAGRGVFLINSLADKVEFENNGSIIFIQFARSVVNT